MHKICESIDNRTELAARLAVYAVTHRYGTDEQLLAELQQALAAGVRIVQLREKVYQGEVLLNLAKQVRDLTRRYNALLIINDDISLAINAGADGVHLGQSDGSIAAARLQLGSDFLIGATAHTVEEAIAAQADGADYLGVGDVFGTKSKPDTIPLSFKTLQDIVANVTIPIVAIGGVNTENANHLAGSGIDGFAVITAIFGQTDIPEQIGRLKSAAALLKQPAPIKRVTKFPKALTIAGSDSSGGAGIQADLKTMTMHGVYGMSVITALTAQNTIGVQDILDVTPEFVAQQMDSIFTDIRPNSVKIGMVSNEAIISVIAAKLREHSAEHIVVDPVMVATSGSNLIVDSAVSTLITELFPLSELVTPNLQEAETLCGFAIKTEADMEHAGKTILRFGSRAVLVKGGHFGNTASDYLVTTSGGEWLRSPRIQNTNTHGTGCTLSSAIASNLAKGMELTIAVRHAKKYLTSAIAAGLDLGKGRGPLLHMLN